MKSFAAPRRRDGWTERRLGGAVVHEHQGEAKLVQGALLVGEGMRVDAMRVQGVPGSPVWLRKVSGGLWRRGRLAVTDTAVEFLDESAATEGDRADLPAPNPDSLFKAALLGATVLRTKAVASEVYATLLFVALASGSWEDDRGRCAIPSDRAAEDIIVNLTGRDYSWVAAYLTNGELLDEQALDEEVAGDIKALGWKSVAPPSA